MSVLNNLIHRFCVDSLCYNVNNVRLIDYLIKNGVTYNKCTIIKQISGNYITDTTSFKQYVQYFLDNGADLPDENTNIRNPIIKHFIEFKYDLVTKSLSEKYLSYLIKKQPQIATLIQIMYPDVYEKIKTE